MSADRSWRGCAVAVLRIAAPTMVTSIFQMLVSLVSLYFVGGDEAPLAAFGLALSFINVMGYSVLYGLTSALDTLVSQAFGANNLPLVGVVVQRAALIVAIACAPVVVMFYFAANFFLAVGVDAAVADISGRVMRIVSFGLLPYGINQVIFKCSTAPPTSTLTPPPRPLLPGHRLARPPHRHPHAPRLLRPLRGACADVPSLLRRRLRHRRLQLLLPRRPPRPHPPQAPPRQDLVRLLPRRV
jgi:hypothetical protein